MSGTKAPEPRGAAAAVVEFCELWRNVSNFPRAGDPGPGRRRGLTAAVAPAVSPLRRDLQSPQRRSGSTHSDSPGEVEPSQDIVWDSTSPTSATSGIRKVKVEISDLVNRIAPKDVKLQKSSLLQWIGDSVLPCTPDIPKQRSRKRSSRSNSVEDLMRLARQFDENMQQDKDNHGEPNINNCEPSVDANLEQPALSCDSAEAELRALFDASTQKVSGPLSQASSKSNKHDDFEDDWDWENDELLADSLSMAIAPEPNCVSNKSHTKHIPDVKATKTAYSAPKTLHTKLGNSALQALCPKPKTSNRSTFKLGPEPVVPPFEATFTAVKSLDKTDDFSDDADDALLYQVCDSVEKTSHSQPHTTNQSDCTANVKGSSTRQLKVTTPVPITATNRLSTFVRSNSLPATCSSSLSFHKPSGSSSIRAQTSQSLPGNRAAVGLFNHVNQNPNTVKSFHKAFKRNVSDSAVIQNKVFVSSGTSGKCSAAEIEKKKQEALARRRQRAQNSQKT